MRPFQAVQRPRRQLQPLNGRLIQLRRQGQRLPVADPLAAAGQVGEQEKVIDESRRRFAQGFQGADGAVGPHIQHQLFVVGALPHPGRFPAVVDFHHRIENGVHRQHAHAQALVFLGPLVALLAGFHGELDGKLGFGIVQRCQVQLRIDNLEIAGRGNIPGADGARPLGIQAHFPDAAATARPGQRRPDADALDVQEQVHHLLLHPRNGAVFVHHIPDFHLGDRAALDGTEQDAAQGVADGMGKTRHQRLQRHLGVSVAGFHDDDAGFGRIVGPFGRRQGQESFQHETCYLE